MLNILQSSLAGRDILELVLIFMAIDVCTGVLKGFKQKKWNSQKAYPIKKVGVLFATVMGYALDVLMETDYVGKYMCYFVIGVEGCSVLENMSALGIPFPSFITQFFEQMKSKGDKK